MFEIVALIGHWLHIAICTFGYVTIAIVVFGLIDELHEWLTRGMAARPIPKGRKGNLAVRFYEPGLQKQMA